MTQRWHRIDDCDLPDDGRVHSVEVAGRSVALARCGARLGALENRCPHQGGPLGEGSIEKGLLRCPWHGYDYDPITGVPPGGFSDAVPAYPVEERAGRRLRRAARRRRPRHARSPTCWSRPSSRSASRHVFGMVGHSNLGFADALRRAEERGEITYIGIRHEGAAAFAASAYGKLTGRPAACFAIAGPGLDEPADRALRREARRLAGDRDLRQVPSKVLGRGAFQDLDLSAVFADVAVSSPGRAGRQRPRRAGRAGGQARDRRPRRRAPRAARRGAGAAVASSRRPRPAGRFTARRILPDDELARRARPTLLARRAGVRCSSSATAPAAPATEVDRARRAARRAGADDVQGQGPGPRHPSARRRRARPQRHAGGELADERVRPARRRRRLVLQPHRHRHVQADRPDRRRAHGDRPVRRRRPSTCSATPR